MSIFIETDAEKRVGAGLLFLIVAIAVLVVQPAESAVTVAVAGLNLLLSALFLLTVGRDTVEDPGYDVGFWLLAMVVALGMYLVAALVGPGEIDLFSLNSGPAETFCG